MNITNEELSALENCTTEKQWNAVCDKIKKARGGEFPPDWYTKVMLSGLIRRAVAKFS